MRRLVLAGLVLVACGLCPAVAQHGTRVNPMPGSVWTYLGPTFGADWVLGGPTTGGVINVVTNYGADSTCATDAAPAFRKMAAAASGKYLLVPPGCYLFASTVPSGYTALNPANVRFQNQKDFVLDMRGAEFRTSDAASYSGMIQIDATTLGSSTRIQVIGGYFVGNHAGYTTLQQACAIVPVNLTDFRFEGQSFGGNWGGLGAAYCGQWMVNGAFRDQSMKNVGQCFDFAFLKNVTFDNIHGYGISADGTSGTGAKCVSIIYDPPSKNDNQTGYTFTNTDSVSVANSSAENFEYGWLVNSGTNITFSNNMWTRNHKGGVIEYSTVVVVGEAMSVGRPPKNVIVSGDNYIANGNASTPPGSGYGIYIHVDGITNDDKIENIVVNNSLFQDNWWAAIEVYPPSPGDKLRNVALHLTCIVTTTIGGYKCIGPNMITIANSILVPAME